MVGTIASIEDPSKLADVIVSHIGHQAGRQAEDSGDTQRQCPELETIYEMMLGEIEILQVEEKIKRRVKKQMEKTQKDYYLNEQMRAIQKEMGEKDDFKSEIEELEKKTEKQEALRGGPEEGQTGDQEAADDGPHVCGSDGREKLYRLASRHALV